MKNEVLELLKRLKIDKSPCLYSFPKLKNFLILNKVFSPKYAKDSYLWPKYLCKNNLVKNKEVLEIGTGSGIFSIYISLYGQPKKVLATDINPQAIKNIKLNKILFDINKDVLFEKESDLFKNIKSSEKFDLICWSIPWVSNVKVHLDKLDFISRSIIDPNHIQIKVLLKKAKAHLKKEGKIFLLSSDFCNNSLISQYAEQYGYQVKFHKFVNNKTIVKEVKMKTNCYHLEIYKKNKKALSQTKASRYYTQLRQHLPSHQT